MSFLPFINPADYDRYKAIYLQTLQQQINNNANNYNSVSLYQKTAQPPITPADTRSIEDRFADEVGTQVRLRALIRQISDNDNTNDIMDDLVKDKILLEFTLQNFPTIKEYFSKVMANGVNYPTFMTYVRKIRDERTTFVENMTIEFPNNHEVDFNLQDEPPKDRPPTNTDFNLSKRINFLKNNILRTTKKENLNQAFQDFIELSLDEKIDYIDTFKADEDEKQELIDYFTEQEEKEADAFSSNNTEGTPWYYANFYKESPKFAEKERRLKENSLFASADEDSRRLSRSLVGTNTLPNNVVDRKKKKVSINLGDVYSPKENFKERNPMFKTKEKDEAYLLKRSKQPSTPQSKTSRDIETPPASPFKNQTPRRNTLSLFGPSTPLHLGTG